MREMLRSRGGSAGPSADHGIFSPGTWEASMTASARLLSAWMRGFQPRTSPSRAAMFLACSSAATGPGPTAPAVSNQPPGVLRRRARLRRRRARAVIHLGQAGEGQLMAGDGGEVGGAEVLRPFRVGFRNSAIGPDLGIYAARLYSLMRPPRTGRRLICSWERSATGRSGRGGRSCRLRWGRRPSARHTRRFQCRWRRSACSAGLVTRRSRVLSSAGGGGVCGKTPRLER